MEKDHAVALGSSGLEMVEIGKEKMGTQRQPPPVPLTPATPALTIPARSFASRPPPPGFFAVSIGQQQQRQQQIMLAQRQQIMLAQLQQYQHQMILAPHQKQKLHGYYSHCIECYRKQREANPSMTRDQIKRLCNRTSSGCRDCENYLVCEQCWPSFTHKGLYI